MQAGEDRRGPGLRFPPPLLPALVVGGGWLLDHRWPLPLPIGEAAARGPGIAVIGLALALAAAALWQFRRARTHVEPWQPTRSVIQTGLFRYSRNPIYLAFCIATGGCALLFDNGWILLGLIPLVGLLTLLVIRREERYLEAKFGDDYLAYKRRVRRWL